MPSGDSQAHRDSMARAVAVTDQSVAAASDPEVQQLLLSLGVVGQKLLDQLDVRGIPRAAAYSMLQGSFLGVVLRDLGCDLDGRRG